MWFTPRPPLPNPISGGSDQGEGNPETLSLSGYPVEFPSDNHIQQGHLPAAVQGTGFSVVAARNRGVRGSVKNL